MWHPDTTGVMMLSVHPNNFLGPGLASFLLLNAAGCTMPNPAFTVSASASESGGATTVQGSTQGPTTGSTVDPTATSTDTTSPETTEAPTATTATTTSDDTTATTGPDPTDTDPDTETDTEPETTEDPCPNCIDEEPACLGHDEILFCENGCSVIVPCEVNELCWTWEDSSSCAEFTADCGELAGEYHGLIQDNRTCDIDEDCQALKGHCQMAGGACWEVVNLDVVQGQFDEITNAWAQNQSCDKEPGVGCMICIGVLAPEVACKLGTCTAEL